MNTDDTDRKIFSDVRVHSDLWTEHWSDAALDILDMVDRLGAAIRCR